MRGLILIERNRAGLFRNHVNRVHFKGRFLLTGGPEVDHEFLDDGFDGLRPAPGGTI
jgi:hypothetical protein